MPLGARWPVKGRPVRGTPATPAPSRRAAQPFTPSRGTRSAPQPALAPQLWRQKRARRSPGKTHSSQDRHEFPARTTLSTRAQIAGRCCPKASAAWGWQSQVSLTGQSEQFSLIYPPSHKIPQIKALVILAQGFATSGQRFVRLGLLRLEAVPVSEELPADANWHGPNWVCFISRRKPLLPDRCRRLR